MIINFKLGLRILQICSTFSSPSLGHFFRFGFRCILRISQYLTLHINLKEKKKHKILYFEFFLGLVQYYGIINGFCFKIRGCNKKYLRKIKFLNLIKIGGIRYKIREAEQSTINT